MKRSSVAKWLFLTDLTDGFKRRITGGFWNSDPSYPYKPHAGIDYGADIGEVLVAYDDYEVIGINSGHRDYGEHVFLYFPLIDKTGLYAHLSQLDVVLGQTGKAQTKIGLVGNTGKSGGPHLHFGLGKGKVTSTNKGNASGDIWLDFEAFDYQSNLIEKGEYINLKPLQSHPRYGYYNEGVIPVAKNINGYLQPLNVEGISYNIIKWVNPKVVLVKTRDFGTVQLFVDPTRSTLTSTPEYKVYG